MGGSVNTFAVLVGLAAFAGWTLSRFSVPRRKGWVHRVGGAGILALLFSIVSPDDDTFQQELIRPATPSVTISAHTRVAQRRSLTDLWINAFVATGDPILAPRTGRSYVADRPLEHQTDFQAPVSIHSPPVDLLSILCLHLRSGVCPQFVSFRSLLIFRRTEMPIISAA